MKPTPEEAKHSLDEISSIVEHTRRSIGHGPTGPILILWGMIWVVGYAFSHYSPSMGGMAWPILSSIGGIGSWIIGSSNQSPTRDQSDARLWIVWVIVALYAILWVVFLLPVDVPEGMTGETFNKIMARKFGAYFACVPMFIYVVTGLWLGKFLVQLGASVTVVVALGYFFAPEWSLLINGFVGGGSLIASGILIRKLWR